MVVAVVITIMLSARQNAKERQAKRRAKVKEELRQRKRRACANKRELGCPWQHFLSSILEGNESVDLPEPNTDSIVTCKCCGEGVKEVKCPFCVMDGMMTKNLQR